MLVTQCTVFMAFFCFTTRMMKKCVKIGEGVYGEVYSTQRNQESVALKVSGLLLQCDWLEASTVFSLWSPLITGFARDMKTP